MKEQENELYRKTQEKKDGDQTMSEGKHWNKKTQTQRETGVQVIKLNVPLKLKARGPHPTRDWIIFVLPDKIYLSLELACWYNAPP